MNRHISVFAFLIIILGVIRPIAAQPLQPGETVNAYIVDRAVQVIIKCTKPVITPEIADGLSTEYSFHSTGTYINNTGAVLTTKHDFDQMVNGIPYTYTAYEGQVPVKKLGTRKCASVEDINVTLLDVKDLAFIPPKSFQFYLSKDDDNYFALDNHDIIVLYPNRVLDGRKYACILIDDSLSVRDRFHLKEHTLFGLPMLATGVDTDFKKITTRINVPGAPPKYIGMDDQVIEGMSGGPLLDSDGNIIGILHGNTLPNASNPAYRHSLLIPRRHLVTVAKDYGECDIISQDTIVPTNAITSLFLSDMSASEYAVIESPYGGLGLDKPYWDEIISILDTEYQKGVVMHPGNGNLASTNPSVEYTIPQSGGFKFFSTTMALGDPSCVPDPNGRSGSVVFTIEVAKTEVVDSRRILERRRILRGDISTVQVPIDGYNKLILRTNSTEDGNYCDHAIWVDAKLGL